ncbi:WYL domain-containing protein [Klebsiella grimontii]|uniref:WYL domain-containing protein n=1 Tax=Klebsiella grimontii TaxID=2058152 RepID=UPI0015E57B43|nr:WYL domain-containing protein [Klebsiella grimontii]QLN46852.1 WYL domain-containing protein [Klebsiella grimontii]
MESLIILLSLSVGIYTIVKICSKPQGLLAKILKSIGALWFFLSAGGLALTPDSFFPGILMMLVGVAFVFYFNKKESVLPAVVIKKSKEHNASSSDADDEGHKLEFENQIDFSKHAHLLKVAFSYENNDGDISFREVDVKKFDGLYIEGYCHSRRQYRTFRIDRVVDEITLRDTGELFTPEEWSEQFYLTV